MFDELKEISYSKEIKDCKSLIVTPYNIKYCKEIKRLKSLRKAEAHLEPRRGSKCAWVHHRCSSIKAPS